MSSTPSPPHPFPKALNTALLFIPLLSTLPLPKGEVQISVVYGYGLIRIYIFVGKFECFLVFVWFS